MILDPFKTTADVVEWALCLLTGEKGVFVGASRVEDTRFWRNEYQGAAMRNAAFDSRFEDNEMQQQLDILNGYLALLAEIPGYMAHCDGSYRLADVYLTFFIFKLSLTCLEK